MSRTLRRLQGLIGRNHGGGPLPPAQDLAAGRPPLPLGRARALAYLGAAGLCITACRPDPGAGRRAGKDDPNKGSAKSSKHTPVPAPNAQGQDSATAVDELAPWFEDRRGKQALEARRYRQYARARKVLQELANDGSASSKDKRGAQLLLAVDDLEQDNPRSAARRLENLWQAPEFALISDELVRMGAQAWLDANVPAMARRLLQKSESANMQSPRLSLLRAELAAQEGDTRSAKTGFEELTGLEDPAVAHRARVKLAALLIQESQDAPRQRARDLLELVQDKHLSPAVQRQADRLRVILSPEGWPSEQVKAEQGRSSQVAHVDRLLRSRNYRAARRAADKRLRVKRGRSASETCELLYLKGTAIFKSRDRAGSATTFSRCVQSCKQAKNVDLEVKCRFQGARGVFAQGRPAPAAKLFENLAKVHASHSYADDALIFAGEAWESAADSAKAKASYEKVLSIKPPGDMRPEARRRLMLLAFSQNRLQDVIALVDKSLAGGDVKNKERAKLLYFRGRAQDRLGKKDKAKQDYIAVVRTLPLSYAAIHAWSRLREHDESVWRSELSRNLIQAQVPKAPPVALPKDKQAQRALLWAQLGLASKARQALRHAGVDGWPRAATLALAGDWWESQRNIANIGTDWRKHPPKGSMRPHWELAHPMVFKDLVLPKEASTKLPSLLSFAIMQTESRFDPSQTSWAGARGLMQLMPGTADFIAKKLGLSKPSNKQLHDPELNIRMGVYNLSNLVSRYGGHESSAALAIPGYNAGPGNVDKWLNLRGEWDLDLFIEAIPFDETRHYTQSVLGRWLAYRWIYGEDKDVESRIPYLPLHTPKQAVR